jgi:hypothetical protein
MQVDGPSDLDSPPPAEDTSPKPEPTKAKPGIPPGSPDWWGHPDAPWDTATLQRWVDEVDADPPHPWRRDGDVYWKSLACPRCTHTMTVELSGGPRGVDVTKDERTPAWCNCQTPETVHGRPEDETEGCGQNGWIRMPEL